MHSRRQVSVSLTLNKNIDLLHKVQQSPDNLQWALEVQDSALRGVLEELSDVADVSAHVASRGASSRGGSSRGWKSVITWIAC